MGKTENVPIGKLLFKIDTYNGKEWSDGTELIEKRLSCILAKLELEGNRLQKEYEDRKKYWEEQEKKECIRMELEKRKQKELSDFTTLLINAHLWNQSRMMYHYIDSIEAGALSKNSLSDELKDWVMWARKKVDWYNPQIQAQDGFLDIFDREKFITQLISYKIV